MSSWSHWRAAPTSRTSDDHICGAIWVLPAGVTGAGAACCLRAHIGGGVGDGPNVGVMSAGATRLASVSMDDGGATQRPSACSSSLISPTLSGRLPRAPRMRILLLTQFFDPEPAAIPGMPWADWLTRRGHDVEVVTGFPNYPASQHYPGYPLRWFQNQTSTPGYGSTECRCTPATTVRHCEGWPTTPASPCLLRPSGRRPAVSPTSSTFTIPLPRWACPLLFGKPSGGHRYSVPRSGPVARVGAQFGDDPARVTE